MKWIGGYMAALALVAAACSTSPPPSEGAFASAAAACRSMAFDQGYEVLEVGEAQSVPGGITMPMDVRKDGQTETRNCMFSQQRDRASFQ
jgi:hypothetical protein